MNLPRELALDFMSVVISLEDIFPRDVCEVVKELVEHNETGVALEILCSQANECGIVFSSMQKKILRDIALEMKIPLEGLDGL